MVLKELEKVCRCMDWAWLPQDLTLLDHLLWAPLKGMGKVRKMSFESDSIRTCWEDI